MFFADDVEGQLNAIQGVVSAAAELMEHSLDSQCPVNVSQIANVIFAAMEEVTEHSYP